MGDKDKIEYIAVFASGQQGLGVFKKNKKSNSGNVFTGSVGKYRKTGKYWINGKSLGAQFARCDHDFCFNPRTTLQFSVFDLRFEYQYSAKRRNAVIKGWIRFLLHKAKCEKSCKDLKAIYLAGTSRGGCFAFRMAKKLVKLRQLQHVKIIGLSGDGVCKGKEFGVVKGNDARTIKQLLKTLILKKLNRR